MQKSIYLTVVLSLVFAISCNTGSKSGKAESDLGWEEMNTSKSDAKEAFKDAKYGMFIHWGIYSIPAGIWKGKKMEELKGPKVAEWIQLGAEIPRDEYAELAKQFNPVEFDADAIARLAKEAGMKYLVHTSKHHDGFAMYDSDCSDYDIMDASPFKRDIVAELYEACKKYDLDFGLYYSHNIDWMDGNDCGYTELLESGLPMSDKAKRKMGANTWDPSPNTFSEYLENKAYPQVKEILTKFPDMISLWYDMGHYVTPDQSMKFYKIAYDLQPNMLINSRVGHELGDFDIPGDNKIPADHLSITKPWETVGTTNNSWGYKSYDNDWKSPKELLFWLIEIVSKGGNYMLNIGPKASGEVPQQSIDNLLEVGKWLKVNGEAIYETRKWKVSHEGPTTINMEGTSARAKHGFQTEFTPQDFWFTMKGKDLYAIALEYPDEKVLIKSLGKDSVQAISNVKMLGIEEDISWKQHSEGLEINLESNRADQNGYALKIELK